MQLETKSFFLPVYWAFSPLLPLVLLSATYSSASSFSIFSFCSWGFVSLVLVVSICEGILLSNEKRPGEIPSWWENRRGECAGQGDLGLNLNKNLEDLPRGQSKKEMLEIHEDHPLQNKSPFENGVFSWRPHTWRGNKYLSIFTVYRHLLTSIVQGKGTWKVLKSIFEDCWRESQNWTSSLT